MSYVHMCKRYIADSYKFTFSRTFESLRSPVNCPIKGLSGRYHILPAQRAVRMAILLSLFHPFKDPDRCFFQFENDSKGLCLLLLVGEADTWYEKIIMIGLCNLI
mgnify:CR=1 FL=1